MATVVQNPIQDVHAHSGGGRASRPSLVAAQQVVKAKATQATSFFKADPWQSTATLASFISLAFLLISLISPWLMFTTNDFPVPSVNSAGQPVNVTEKRYGQATLLDVRTCIDIDAPSSNISPYLPDKACTTWLNTNGPTALEWMRKAGGAAFAFVIFAIAPGFMAFWLTYLRRIGALKSLPAVAMRFRDHMWTVSFHLLTAFFMMIAWSVWAGQVNSNRNVATYASLGIYDQDLNITSGVFFPTPFESAAGPVTGVSVWFGGGFGIAVTSFILSIISAVIIYFFHTEKVPAPEGGVAAHPNAMVGAAAPADSASAGAYSGVDAHTGVARGSLPFPPAAASSEYRVPAGGYGNDDAAPSSMNDVKI